MKDYLLEAYKLKELISTDPRFIKLNEAEKKMEESEEVMALSYNKDLKETYLSDALRHYDKNSPEVRKARLEFFHAHEKLDAHPLVKEYLESYKEVEKLLKEVNDILFKDIIGNKYENCRR